MSICVADWAVFGGNVRKREGHQNVLQEQPSKEGKTCECPWVDNRTVAVVLMLVDTLCCST
jgi:hypothetical protein